MSTVIENALSSESTIKVENQLADHYCPGGLLGIIETALTELNKTPATVTLDDLAPVEEFHVGGREASRHLLDPLKFSSDDHLLDIGCGLGGTARFVASHYGSRVTGFDLTADFVDTGKVLNSWLHLQDRINLQQGSVLSLPSVDATFSGAYMVHVGMNIKNKAQLFKEVYRVMQPGGVLAIYDLLRTSDGELSFPVPWSSAPETSFVDDEASYRQALQGAGFTIKSSENRHGYALEFYAQMKTQMQQAGGPGPMGLHLLMGETAATKLDNAYAAITNGIIAPVEIIARK